MSRQLCAALFVLPLLFAPARADEAKPAEKISAKTPAFNLALTDVHGNVHRLEQRGIEKALVFVFLNTECPIANGFVPTLNKLHAKWTKANPDVTFYGVISDRFVTRAAAKKHSKEYRIRFPVLFDASGELATLLKPTHTPEAFVLNADGKIVYRGRINNAWVELGKRRREVTAHDLANAVAAVSTGKPVQAERTKPIGCLFEATTPLSDDKATITYNRDIAPIVNAACVKCHRGGEVAPFPLTSYRDVAKRARQIARVTQSRFMPPWKPKANFGHFRGERRLTKSQIALITRWAKNDAPKGDAKDLPQTPKFSDGWKLGKPDLIVKVPKAFKVPAGGPDLFRNFVIPLNNKRPKFVVAAEFRPGNRRVVHHSIMYLDTSRIARMRDRLDPKPGYGTFGAPGFVPAGDVGGWAPGYEAKHLSGGHARYVPKGSDLVIQIHYHPSGKPETDQSQVGLYFTERPKNIAAVLTVGDIGFTLPAGAKRHKLTATYKLPSKVNLLAVTPHMHLLGKEMKVTAKLPNGKVKPLIWIDDWSFDWQDQYFYDRPFSLPKDTVLKVEAWYDNSAGNPLNPNHPPKPVRFGDASDDEMMFCFFLVSKDNPRDLLPLVLHNVLPVGSAMLTHYLRKVNTRLKRSAEQQQDNANNR